MFHRWPLCALALLAAAGCSDPGPRSSGVPRSIEPVSTTVLIAQIGTTLGEPLVARVVDEQDRPVRGARVLFTVADQMATLAPSEATTDARGEVRTTVTLGTIAGRVDINARIAGSDSSTQYTVTATALGPSDVTAVPDPMWLHGPGESGRLFAAVVDQHGNWAGTSSITWRSLDETIATVDGSTAVVTAGVQTGATARIEARSAEGFVDTVLVSVADAATTPCLGTTPVQLAPGESVVLDPRHGTCFRSPASADYVAVPFFASEASNSQTDELRIVGTGIRYATIGGVAPVTAGSLRLPQRPMPDDGFDAALRMREERELAPLVADARASRSRTEHGPAFNAIPANPAVGDMVTINASPVHACSFPSDAERTRDMRTGRIVAITQKAIVVADVANPSGGFTTEEYRQLGTTFDTLVAPLDEQLFGTPGDVDQNQRSVIFYTRRVNEITTSSDSYVGGFFWSRDLLPRNVCGTSNVAEIFYMLVPDPNGEAGAPRSRSFVQQVTVGTLAHEYQHLINASRRMADPLADAAESTWLNEGLSHIAEEMLFYRTSGLQPRANIGAQQFTGTVKERYYEYQHSNITRFERWLTSPSSTSPYGLSITLATRGAAWAFLRYLADRFRTDDGDLWFRLANNRESGIANVEEVFGVDILDATRDWAVAMYTDDLGATLPPAYRFASWNLRSLYPALPRGEYPIAYTDLTNNSGRRITLRGGGSGFFPFRSAAGVDTRVWLTTAAGSPIPPVKVTVVRVR